MANSNNNDDKKRIYDSLSNWLQDCFDDIKGHDNLDHFKKLGFDQELKNGKEWAESKRTLSKINNFFVNNFNASPTIVPMRNNEGWRIVYKPANAEELGLREDQWPSLEIELSKDGATIHNTMWSPETAAYIRGQNGQVGLTSLPNAALRQVLNDLEAQESSIKTVMRKNKKEGFQYLKTTVSGAVRDIKNLSPAVYSPSQVKEYDKLNQGNVKRKRMESLEAMKTMADYSSYVRSVYNSLDNKAKYKVTEKQFARMVDDIITYSRYVDNITQLQDIVHKNYSYIYKNAWFGELENFYGSLVGKVKQGTMTEGSVGKIMFSEPDVIAANIGKAGKKIGQNLQVHEQFSHFGKNVPTVARGRSNAFTKTQYAKIKEQIKSGQMNKDNVYKDLYEVAYISDLSLKKAYEEISEARKNGYDPKKLTDNYKKVFGTRALSDKEFKAIQHAALKGFGNDAVLISEGLADEFKEIKEFKRYKDNVVSSEEANEAIRKRLIKDRMNKIRSVKSPNTLKGDKLTEYNNYVKELEELKNYKKNGKDIFELGANGSIQYNFEGSEKALYDYLKKAYNLDSLSWIDNFTIDNGKFVDVVGHRKMDHHNFVGRAGVSGDIRALLQKSHDSLLAYGMAISGYGDNDIWTTQGGKRVLRPAVFQDSTQEFKDSNARTIFMQQFHRVMSYIDQNAKKASQSIREKGLGDDIESYLKKDNLVGQFISFDGENILFDQEAFFDKYNNKAKGEKQNSTYNVVNAIQGLVKIGKDIGLLSANVDYFQTVEHEGKEYLVQKNPLLGMTEIGESSTDQYGGLGRETHSGFKLDWKAISAMKGTLGNFEKFIKADLAKGENSEFRRQGESNKEAFERLVKPVKNMVETNVNRLEEQKKKWDFYVKNAEYLKQTFTNQGKARQKALEKDIKTFKITLDDIQELYTAKVDWGSADGLESGEFLGQNFFRTASDKTITEKSTQDDIKKKLNPLTRVTIYAEQARKMEYRRLKKIHGEKQLKEWGILGPESIQPYLDLGEDRLIANIGGVTKSVSAIPLALGSYDKKAAKSGIFMPDKTAGYTENLVRTIAQIYSPETTDSLEAKRRATFKVEQYLKDVQDEYNTNVYDKTHTVTNYKESGYLRLAALSDFSEKIFKDIANDIQGLDEKGKKNLASVQRILSTEDFAAMASEMYNDEKGKKELLKLYEVTTGGKWEGKGKNKFIKDLTDLFDISKEGYKGYTFSGGGQLRNPIIKFMDDLHGGKTVLSSNTNLVGKGTMAINKHLAASGKGDMDGDMVAFMYAFAAGDLEGAQEALDRYFLDLQNSQKDADIVSKKVEKAAKTRQALGEKLGLSSDAVEMMMRFGEASKINDPANSTHKKMTVASMWFNKKGAGIFGNEAFEAQKVLEYLGVDAGNNGVNDTILQLGGGLFSALTQTLYQEGISAKKAGPGALIKAASIHTMGNQARTWDDEDQLRVFLGYLKDLEIIDEKGMFKDNSLQKIGLGSLSKDEEALKQLKDILTKQKKVLSKKFGGASKKVENITEDIETVNQILETGQGQLQNVSEEMFIAMIKLFNKEATSGSEKSLGKLIKTAPYRIFNNEIKGLTSVSDKGSALGEIEKSLVDKIDKKSDSPFLTRNQQILGASELFIGPRVTSRAQRMLEDNGKDIPIDLFNITQAMKEYGELDPNKKKDLAKIKELESYRNENYSNIINNNLTPFKAVTGGTIAHKAAELMHLDFTAKKKDIFKGQRNYTPESVYKYFQENHKDLLENYKRQYQYFLPEAEEDEVKEFIMSSLFKGVGNYEYVHDSVAGRGGKILGVEIPLATFSNPENGHMAIGQGTSDIISFYRDVDKKNPKKIISHLDIGDYKNTSLGQLKAENVFQGMDYRQSIIDMFDDVAAKGGIGQIGDFEAYLSQGNFTPDDLKDDSAILKKLHEDENNVINAILWRLHNEALDLSGNAAVGSSKYRKAYNMAKQKYEELYNKSGEVSPEDIGIRFYSHGADGFMNEYLININDELKELFNKEKATFFKSGSGIPRYDWGGYHESEQVTKFLNKSAQVVGSRFIGSDEQADKLFSGELFKAQKAYKRLVADKTSVAIKQQQLDALEREEYTPENVKRAQELKKEIEDLNTKIGEEISPKDAKKKVKDIDKKIVELNEKLADENTSATDKILLNDQISSLTEEREDLTKSDYFKLALARDKLRQKKVPTKAKMRAGDKGYISGSDYDDALHDQYLAEEEKKIKEFSEEQKKLLAEQSLVRHAKEYKSLSLQSARANAQKDSKILSDEEKEFVDEQATELALSLVDKRKAIEKEVAIVGQERAKKLLGEGFDTSKMDEINKGKAEREVDVYDRQKMASLETKIYEYYLGQFKLQEQITRYEEQISKAVAEGNDLAAEVLRGKKENAEKIKLINEASAKAQLKDIPGWNQAIEDAQKEKAKNQVELERKMERDAKSATLRQNRGGSGGGGGGVGFLGIDAHTARWLSRMMQGGGVAAFIRLVRRGFRDLTNKAKQLDQAMTNLRIVTGKNVENARTLINGYAELGKKLGATTLEVTNAAQAWLRQGYDIAQVNDLVTSSLYLSKLGMIDTATATQNLTSAMHGFKLEASEAMDVVDKLTALDVKAATTAGDIAQGLSQFANIASLGGVSVDQAAAYVATIADVNQMSGITVGQSLKTIMSRYGNVKAGAYNKLNIDSESTDTSEKLNDVERVLNKMGISIRKTNLEFKDFDEVLNEIAEKWNTLDNVSKRAISNAFAGVRQQEAFMILLENYDKYKDLLKVSENSQGTAERKYQSYKDSYAFSKNELTAALEQVTNSSEISKLLTDLTKIGTKIVEVLQNIYPLLPGIISNFMMYRTIQGKGLLNTGYNLLHRGFGSGIGGIAGSTGGYGLGATPIGRAGRGLWEGIKQLYWTGSFRDVEDIADKDSERYHKARRHYNYIAGKKGLKKADEYWNRTEKVSRKQKDRDEKIKQKQEKKYQDQQLKYIKQGYLYAQKEVSLKRQLLTPAQKEVLSKNAVLSEATKEKLVEKGILQNKQQELTYEQTIALLNSDILSDETLKKLLENDIYNIALQRKRVEGEITEEAATRNVQNVGGARKTIGNINASPQAIKANNWRAGLSYVEMGANLVMTSLSQLTTAATTHTYEGETVESSKEAQKKGAGVSAALSLIPVVGSFIGPLAGEAVAAAVDKERDRANYSTKVANENLSKLESLTSSLDQLGGAEAGSAERHKLVQEFKKNIFDADNVDLRKQLQRHLGKTNISSLLEKIDGNTASATESLEALKKLQVAQIQAEKAQIFNKYASTMYEDNRELNETISKIEGYDGVEGSTIRDALGIAALGTAAGAGAGALTGLAIGASAGSAGGPVGAAIGALVGVAAGLLGGVAGASAYAEGDKAGNKANNSNLDKVTNWQAMNSIERADITREALEEAQKSIVEIESSQDELRQRFIEAYLKRNGQRGENSRQAFFTEDDAIEAYEKYKNGGYANNLDTIEEKKAAQELKNSEKQLEELSTLVSEYNNMITILERQTSVEMQILSEMNDLTLQEALINAKDKDNNKYITEMSIAELKHVGIDEILTSYANAIKESGGLKGIGIWADAGQTKLSEAGYEYLFEQLKKQGDEEINAVLRGQAYTLQEAIDLRKAFGPESFQVKKLLESFSSAFDLTIEDIEEESVKLKETLNNYGLLTLADGMASTSELIEKVGSFTDLMNSVANGAGETSAWMEKIISQFPQLIKYMGNTSELFAQSIKYLDQLSEQYINAQTDELLENEAYYSSIEKDLYAKLGEDSEAAKSLRASKASSLSGVITWIQTQYVNGELTTEAEEVLAKLVEVTEEAGTTIVSKIDKAFYDQLIEYKTKTIDYILENLNSQKEALQNINSEREYENKLIEARLKLEDASKQKKRVYRAGVGWVYEADQSAIESAQKSLKSLETEKQISELDVRIATLEGVKAEINSVYDKENYENLEKLYDKAVERGKVENSMNGFLSSIKTSVNGIAKKLSAKIKEDVVPGAQEEKKLDMTEAKRAWGALLGATPGTEEYNTAVNNFHTAMAEAQANGATEEDVKSWDSYFRTGARIEKGMNAWQVYEGDIEKQTQKVKHTFNVAADKNDSDKRFIGYTNGDELLDTQVQAWLLDGIKSGNALAWIKTDEGLIGPISVGSDARFKYQEDKSLSDYFTRITTSYPTLGKQILISDPSGENEAVMYDNGELLKVTNSGSKDLNGLFAAAATDEGVGSNDQFFKAWEGNGENSFSPEVWNAVKEKYGQAYNYMSTSELNKIAENEAKARGYAEGTLSLINEKGTEAIITPQGTLTALPSKTGILPADITKNLWQLGEVAPSLLNIIDGRPSADTLGKSIFDTVSNDDSFNIDNLVMNVNADSSFDVEKFISLIRSRVALTKNSK